MSSITDSEIFAPLDEIDTGETGGSSGAEPMFGEADGSMEAADWETDTEADFEIDTEADWETDTEADWETDTETDTEADWETDESHPDYEIDTLATDAGELDAYARPHHHHRRHRHVVP